MIKLKNILTEKKDLDSKTIQKVAALTDRNNHTESRKLLAKVMGDKKLFTAYQSIQTLQDFIGRANETNVVRNYLDLRLKNALSRKFSNFDEIWKNL